MERPVPSFSIEQLKISLGIEDPDPGGKTIPEWAKFLGIGREDCRARITSAVEAGTWVRCIVLRKNRRYPGYKPVEVSDE